MKSLMSAWAPGTTGAAAVSLGRSFIGMESDPDYFRVAADRIIPLIAALAGVLFVRVLSIIPNGTEHGAHFT